MTNWLSVCISYDSTLLANCRLFQFLPVFSRTNVILIFYVVVCADTRNLFCTESAEWHFCAESSLAVVPLNRINALERSITYLIVFYTYVWFCIVLISARLLFKCWYWCILSDCDNDQLNVSDGAHFVICGSGAELFWATSLITWSWFTVGQNNVKCYCR